MAPLRARITAQLIDATTDVHVWSQSYERDLSPANVFEIQSEIAQQIANALQVQLLEYEGERPTANPTAWDLYMGASAGRYEDAQAIVQEMLSAQPEITAERGVEVLARFWNEEWIPEDLEAQLRSAGLP